MALGAALVDRARLISQQPMRAKVEGSTVASPVKGPWFKARLTLPPSPEAPQAPDVGRRAVVLHPQLLTGRKDGEGNTLTITAAQKIEVNSRQLGRAIWEVTGDPEPLRKRRSILGWQADLKRIDDHEMEPV